MYTSIFFCFSYSLYVHPTFRRSVDIFLNAIFVFVQIDCKHFPHFTDFKLILNIVCYNMFKEHILNCPRWSHETCTKSANPFLKPKGYKCDQITVPPPPPTLCTNLKYLHFHYFCYYEYKKRFDIHLFMKPFPWRLSRRLFWISTCCTCVSKMDISLPKRENFERV